MVNKVMTGEYIAPFSEFPFLNHDFQIILQSAKKNLRPTIPLNCPTAVKEMISLLWSKNPERRPSESQLLSRIKALRSVCPHLICYI
jgi:hypothetical protein